MPAPGEKPDRSMTLELPPDLAEPLRRAVDSAARDRLVERLFARDASLWTGGDEARWLGWLDVVERERPRVAELELFARQVIAEGFTSVLLLGMGGSSLGPEVLETVFGSAPGAPRLRILDSTDPAQVLRLEREAGLDHTLFLVASKSGTTLEPSVLFDYFFERVRARHGASAGRRFAAITDPGSRLEAVARERGLRAVFLGEPEIGGRYSALSRFGLVPAALLGVDLGAFLDRARAMIDSCGPGVAADENPGLGLGLLLGLAARGGRDKLTIHTSPALWDLGAWLEQLVAESTGKNGVAIVPVDGEPLAGPSSYGGDRLFVHLRLRGEEAGDDDARLRALAGAGHPVVRLELAERLDLGAEFARWEIATALAGSVLGIHPFDQPDVEASKVASRRLTDAFEESGALPVERAFTTDQGLRWFADAQQESAFEGVTGGRQILDRHLARAHPGDYLGLLVWLDRSDDHRRWIQQLRRRMGERTGLPVCVGFGPRFLHSTGQAYKGGPNSGVFLQISADDAQDLAIPGRRATFGAVKAAQARGDFEVLAARERRALRVQLGRDTVAGLQRLLAWLDE